MRESKIYDLLQRRMQRTGISLVRVEVPTMPDIYYYMKGKDGYHGWIELKHVQTFYKTIIRPPWRPGQLMRGRDLAQANVNIWALIISDQEQEATFIHGRHWKSEYDRKELFYYPELPTGFGIMEILQKRS